MKKRKQRYSQGKTPIKGALIGVVAVVASLLLLGGLRSGLFRAVVSAIIGFIAFQMGTGLDTSKKAPQKEVQYTGDEKVDAIIDRGMQMLDEIRSENLRIRDMMVSRKIDELESVAGKIFKAVVEDKRRAPQIRRFMDYYLPTTLKMLSGYRMMDEQNLQSEQSKQTKEQIVSALDVVIAAFKKQLENLYQHNMLDISTDIEVLETLLQKDVDISALESHTAQQTTQQSGAYAIKEE